MSEVYSKSQVQALINEYKGNLFESLVGREIASLHGIEDTYWQKMSPSLRTILKDYESKLRAYDAKMITHLGKLAKDFISEVKSHLPIKITNIYLVGKLAANQSNFPFPEADIVLECDEIFFPLSIKLSKDKAFVNTKSAGVRSFFPKYVTHPKIDVWQMEINRKLDLEFSMMARKLYEDAGLEFEGDTKFQRWKDLGLPILSGQLGVSHQKIVHAFYISMRDEIYSFFEQLSASQLFATANQLSGQRADDIFQLICFHSGTDLHDFRRALVQTSHEPKEQWKLGEKNADLTSFELNAKNKTVQIRLKAMNSFIVPALKVNCAVKYAL